MRAILQVESGSQSGHKLLIVSGQSLEIGRSHLVDLSFADDARMSGRHFRIINDGASCQVQDLGSTNGTHINGQPVRQAAIGDNDLVVAGETQFRVRIEATTISAARPLVATDKLPRAAITATAGPRGHYTSQQHPSTIYDHRGAAVSLPPAELARQLSRRFRTLLIADSRKLTPATQARLPASEFLLDGIPAEVQATVSPRLLLGLDDDLQRGVVEELWGQDTMIGVCSPAETELPVAELRRLAGAFMRPSILTPQITRGSEPFVRLLMTGITAIWSESESPGDWVIYSLEPLHELLTGLGLTTSRDESPQDKPEQAQP